MFETWKRQRKLERELDSIYDLHAPSLQAAKLEDDHRAAYEIYSIEVAETRSELESILTHKTRRKAEKFGLGFPPFEKSEDNWEDIAYSSRRALTEKARAKINRQVSEARFAYWKRWVELLVPILSLLVSLVLAFAALKK